MEYILNNVTEILLLFFLVITFLQSGIEKAFNWGENLSWLKEHFAHTPLKGIVPFLLGTLLLTELVAGTLCTIGIYQIVVMGQSGVAFYGAILSCISLLMLLFGQRMAKDYEGAKTIAVYFVPAILLVFLLQG